MMELLDKLASLTGWVPIALVAIALIPIGIFFYTRELSNKDITIQRLNIELENSKQYRVDLLVSSLDERVNIANRELERLRHDKNTSQEEIASKEQEVLTAKNEIRDLKTQLQQYEDQLDDLLDNEPDFCMVCDVDDEHILLNTISWAYSTEGLIGDTALVEKQGTCSYCDSINLKCRICGSITGIDTNAHGDIECEGGCGNLYALIPEIVETFTQYTIKVSRMVDIDG